MGDHQLLPGLKGGIAAQGPVVPPQLPEGNAVALGDGIQGLSRLHGVDPPGKTDHQGLAHRQLSPVNAVICRQPDRVHPVSGGNGGHGLTGLYHMDRHIRLLSAAGTANRLLKPMTAAERYAETANAPDSFQKPGRVFEKISSGPVRRGRCRSSSCPARRRGCGTPEGRLRRRPAHRRRR